MIFILVYTYLFSSRNFEILFSPEVVAAIIAGLFALYIAKDITSESTKKATLRSESVWRKSLFTLASKDQVKKSDLECLRTCISALKGFIPETYENNNDVLDFDVYEPEFVKNDRYKLKDSGDLGYFVIEFIYFTYSKYGYGGYNSNLQTLDGFVFRQICRLLLESDWLFRSSDSENRVKKMENCSKKMCKTLRSAYRKENKYDKYFLFTETSYSSYFTKKTKS